jgi:target of EGR1 protein 1
LGLPKLTRTPNIEDRYCALHNVAKSHAIVAFGLSVSQKDKETNKYSVQNFHFSMLCTQEYLVCPQSISFLVSNGFDFNEQIKDGIPYIPGNDSPAFHNTTMRDIFMVIVEKKCPIVLHNGLLDLMFLYQSFFAELPKSLPVFIADCTIIFKGGIYDTKYIADYIQRESSSFLSYLFRKYQRLNEKKILGGKGFEISIRGEIIHNYKLTTMSLSQLGLAPMNKVGIDTGKPFCEQYASHGVCHQVQNL